MKEKLENTKLLPKLQKDSILNTEEILCKQVFTKHPPRYSEIDLSHISLAPMKSNLYILILGTTTP